MKSYTDLGQSKKLAEFLPLESADMCWILVNYGDEAGSRHEPSLVTYKTGSHFRDRIFPKDHTIPCWSLASLLGVIPKRIKHYNVLTIDISENEFAIRYDEIAYRVNNDLPDITKDNPVDACVEMVIRLHELNLL